VYSLNVAPPWPVERLAEELRPALREFETVRETHTLLVKRLGNEQVAVLADRARRRLQGVRPVEVTVAGIDYFERPTKGTAPVVYLAVESPGLEQLHRRLCETFAPVDGLEGAEYVPHVTLARGGSVADARALAEREVDLITWTVEELLVWDAVAEESHQRFSLER